MALGCRDARVSSDAHLALTSLARTLTIAAHIPGRAKPVAADHGVPAG
jgi:hypothetical protein